MSPSGVPKMKVLLSLAAVLALAVGVNLTAVDAASAWCGGGWRCGGGAVLVPAPNPIPIRRVRVAPALAPCGGCGGVPAYAPPPPCGSGGCGGAAFFYAPTRFYAYWAQPGYTACYPGVGNCYWRRDCWYDSFGRRFCN
jgi:hypothetical protein